MISLFIINGMQLLQQNEGYFAKHFLFLSYLCYFQVFFFSLKIGFSILQGLIYLISFLIGWRDLINWLILITILIGVNIFPTKRMEKLATSVFSHMDQLVPRSAEIWRVHVLRITEQPTDICLAAK